MKCPKCGYVGHPGLPQCKKCGRQFGPAPRKETSWLTSSPPSAPSTQAPTASTQPPPPEAPYSIEAAKDFTPPAGVTPEPARASAIADAAPVPLASPPGAQTPAPLWRKELSGRVQKFRRRRARLRSEFDPSTTPNLEFEADEENQQDQVQAAAGGEMMEFEQHRREREADAGAESEEHSALDEQTLGPSEAGLRVLSGAAVQAGEMPLGQRNVATESVEIILDSGRVAERGAPAQAERWLDPRSLLGRRFLAGLADVALLLVSGGIFATIFWAICHPAGAMRASPANLIALGFIVDCLILFYFGMSVAFTCTTPGLAWMGLEVRNLDGELPSTSDSMWRAFGYLVSASALFLGFVWALLDADGLAWHDLMSETYVTMKEDRQGEE